MGRRPLDDGLDDDHVDADVTRAIRELKTMGCSPIEDDKKMKKRKPRKRNPQIRNCGPDSPFYSFQQVMDIIPLGRTTIYQMISKGEFPAQVKLGQRAAVWSKQSINDWIASKLKS